MYASKIKIKKTDGEYPSVNRTTMCGKEWGDCAFLSLSERLVLQG